MSSIGKRILSAFVEVTGKTLPPPEAEPPVTVAASGSNRQQQTGIKFSEHFEKLFREANRQGPDYFEFSKMIGAMNGIADEKARYTAAFAGLQVQGLDKQKLLATAAGYLQLLEQDAAVFQSTIDTALQERVVRKQSEIEETNRRIQQLSQEISDLQQKISVLNSEINENEEKIESSTGGYRAELENRKSAIVQNMEKIKQHIL